MAVFGEFISISLEVKPVPEAAPVHPAKIYCVPVVPACVAESIFAVAVVPAGYQPELLVVPWSEFTVK